MIKPVRDLKGSNFCTFVLTRNHVEAMTSYTVKRGTSLSSMVHQKELEVTVSGRGALRVRDGGRGWSREPNRSHKHTPIVKGEMDTSAARFL